MAILNTISDLGKTMAQKSSDFAESGKLTINIKKKEHDIKKIYIQIGQYIFDKHLNGAIYDETITDFCNEIEKAMNQIDDYKADRENIGVSHLDVEVVEKEVSDTDSDFVITKEDEELLKDL